MFVFMGSSKLHLFGVRAPISAKLDAVDNVEYDLKNNFKIQKF